MTSTNATNPVQSGRLRPEWIRLPRPGARCEYTGLQRAALEKLIHPRESNGNKPLVRSCILKDKGAVRGCRLVNLDSYYAYLDRLSEEQAEEQAAKAS